MKNRTKLPNIYLAVIMIIMYLPLVFVVVFSFNESKLTAAWTGFSLKWYQTLWHNEGLREALWNSIVLGVLSCGVSAVIGTIGAIGMARVNYKSKGIVEYISTLPIMIPEIILGMVFLAFFSLLNLPFGMTTLVIAHTTFCIPYIFMMVKARLVGIDKSIAEAARDLGATQVRTFFDITLPLIMPAVMSGCLLAFAMSFDDVVISIFVNGPKLNTLPIKIYTQLKTGVTPEINALCTVILITVIFILFITSALGNRGRRTDKGN
ncbi:ABC transporter permease [Lactonifactor longoviformis]|uniref:Spermidine/putrescine transport system permease protein n=1 Tax=Lactonifactor longoviformis DSM 17459 TaxID=1122155 RepID=A0A1M4VCU7_9CLOT|nr:ABC transporter permease [Lactonifactor longoviformis]POP31432.1 ABC transporter permease [Lactonifactor longoviformis]SHE66650.1 spermidine/putrescine transport system permease protein [Lactonifactor longoviformis DSM 17459]